MRPTLLTSLAAALLAASGPAQEAPPPPATFAESVVVRVIDVDVVVLDRDGHSVRGLGRDDFELLEDGKPVEISNFLAYEADASAPATTVTLEPPLPGVAPAAPMAPTPAAPPPVTWVVYVDQARVDPGPRSDTIRQIDSFLDRGVRPGDRILVASFDGAALEILCRLTEDRSIVRQALDKLRRQSGYGSLIDSQRATLRRQIIQADPNDPLEAGRLLDATDVLADHEFLQSRAQTSAARDLLAILRGIEGRISVIWAGAGLDAEPGETLYRYWESKFGSRFGRNLSERQLDVSRMELLKELPNLVAAATSGRFTLFTIQVGSHQAAGLSADAVGLAEGESFSMAETAGLREGSSMAALATATGGRTFVASPQLATRLEAVTSDLSTYYSLGYHPSGDEPGRRRKLDVRVRPAGLRVLHRAQVTDSSWQEEAASSTISALVDDTEPENPFGIVLVVGPQPERTRRRGALRMPIEVRIPLQQLTLLPDGDQHQGNLWFEFALQDPDGGYRRLDSRPLTFQVPHAKLKEALSQYVSFRVELDMTPGKHRFATTVLDQLSGVRSTLRVPISVPQS